MASVNKVQLIGNAGKDSETKFASNGTQICNFSIATSKKWKVDEEWKEKTEWHNISVFDKLAERTDIKKGDLVFVEGEIQNREYTDQNGVKHYSYGIIGKEVRILVAKADLKVKPKQGEQEGSPEDIVEMD